MTIRKGFIFQLIGVTFLVLACIRCSDRQSRAKSAAPVQTPGAPTLLSVLPAQPHTFNGAGIAFDYPADWVVTQSGSLFSLAAPVAGVIALDRPELNLDVPKLPWHIPGMISAGMVVGGYVDDLRKNHIPDAVVKEQKSIKVGGENAKQITCTGHLRGKSLTDVSVIVVHADRVYIFSTDCDCGGSHCELAAKALRTVVGSVKWGR